MIYLLIIIAIVVLIVCLPHCFETYTNMKYVEHLEKMGTYVDENGKEMKYEILATVESKENNKNYTQYACYCRAKESPLPACCCHQTANK